MEEPGEWRRPRNYILIFFVLFSIELDEDCKHMQSSIFLFSMVRQKERRGHGLNASISPVHI